jgi:hypothetical protein
VDTPAPAVVLVGARAEWDLWGGVAAAVAAAVGWTWSVGQAECGGNEPNGSKKRKSSLLDGFVTRTEKRDGEDEATWEQRRAVEVAARFHRDSAPLQHRDRRLRADALAVTSSR